MRYRDNLFCGIIQGRVTAPEYFFRRTVVKKNEGIEKAPRCRICAHEDREGIEMLGIMSCASWNICTARINNTFGTNFTVECVRKHMTEHELHKTAMEQGVIIDSIRGADGAPGIISAETMLQTLLIQGMMDLAKGKIRCKTPAELIAVMNTLGNVQRSKEAKYALESGDTTAFYNIMAAYGAAINDTVSPQQMRDIVAKANALGANFNISNVELETPIDVEPIDYMQQMMEDVRTMGRSRTRDELIEAGVLDEIDRMM